MQAVARKQDWPLDRMCLVVEVTKKQKEELQTAPKDGAYIHKYDVRSFIGSNAISPV